MTGLRQLRPISIEEYLEGERHSDILHEYVGGEPRAMVGATDTHNLIAGNIFAALHGHLRGTACFTVEPDDPLKDGFLPR